MRTTVDLDDDVVAALQRLRQQRAQGLSRAINELIRAGLVAQPAVTRFRQQGYPIGLRFDVTNVAEVLDLLDQEPDD
ncbi:MAG: CopG family transcriptional regulator [Acidimicrobiales bacterium]